MTLRVFSYSLLWVLSSVGLLLGQNPIYDSGGALPTEQAAYDVIYYDLSLSVDTEKKSIEGNLEMTCTILAPLNLILLNLDTLLSVIKVDINDKEVDWKHEGGLIYVYANKTLAVGESVKTRVYYEGKPKKAPNPKRRSWSDGFFWATTDSGEPWISNVSVLDGADIWWPCKDHPSDEADSMALKFTVPSGLTVATNGHLRSIIDNQNGTRTHQWFVSTPINNYAVTINIAPYETVETTYKSVTGEEFPFIFWVLPENKTKAKEHFPNFINDMSFLEKVLGPYPFRIDKYGVAETYYFGMETQSIIAYGHDYSLNEFGFDYLHFHELAHEWFANMVTARDWKDWWIHEGFATYMESLYAEYLGTELTYHKYVNDRYFPNIKNKFPVVLSRENVSTREGYISDVYSKGAAILHTLRYLLGKEGLLLAIRRMAYPEKSMELVTDGTQCRLVNTLEFQEIAEGYFGASLDWFFDTYLHYAELPELHVEKTDKRIVLTWKTLSDFTFKMPIQVRIGDELQNVDMNNGEAVIDLIEETTFVVDPERWILMNVVYK